MGQACCIVFVSAQNKKWHRVWIQSGAENMINPRRVSDMSAGFSSMLSFFNFQVATLSTFRTSQKGKKSDASTDKKQFEMMHRCDNITQAQIII